MSQRTQGAAKREGEIMIIQEGKPFTSLRMKQF